MQTKGGSRRSEAVGLDGPKGGGLDITGDGTRAWRSCVLETVPLFDVPGESPIELDGLC
jgi:hypothetical protein